MSSKLITLALILATTASTMDPDAYVGRGQAKLYDEQHQNGEGPSLLDAYAECWRLDQGAGQYGWYFDATVDHTHGLAEVESVWVDVYSDYDHVEYQLYDSMTLQYPLDAPGAEMFNYYTEVGDGVWMRAEYETSPLRCNSTTEYEIYTTVYDFQGNYQTTVEYL